MTDYDRGAYTPQTDAPLAFDPRRPSERRPMPMALIGSAAVLVILLAGVAMVYRGGVRHAGESPRPVGEPVMAVKTAPAAGQTAATSSSPDADVYASGLGNAVEAPAPMASAPASNSVGSPAAAPPVRIAQAPVFAPAAEQPAPRPAPKPATVAMLAKPSAPNHIERPSTPAEEAAKPPAEASRAPEHPAKPVPEHPAKTLKAARVAAPPALRPPVHAAVDQGELAAAGGTRLAEADAPPPHRSRPTPASEDSVAPAKVATAEAGDDAAPKTRTSLTASAAPGKAAVVQIGAFSSSAMADRGYADVSATLPGKMAGKAKHVQPLDKDGSTLYRTWLSGFASRADAVAFCDALKSKGKTCLVKG